MMYHWPNRKTNKKVKMKKKKINGDCICQLMEIIQESLLKKNLQLLADCN